MNHLQTFKLNLFLIIGAIFIASSGASLWANEPDSAYIFAYTTEKQNNTAGLHYAWSVDRENWHPIGPEFRFLFSDFGSWGTQKKMINPFLFQDEEGMWRCFWTLNNDIGQFSHTVTKDLFYWKSQQYPEVMNDGNILDLEVSFDEAQNAYKVTWVSESNGNKTIYKTTTKDFNTYAPTAKANEADRLNARESVSLDGKPQIGVVNKVQWSVIDELIKWHQWSLFHEQERADVMAKDPVRFKDLHSVKASVTVHPERSKGISDLLIGIFFEDINYAADGGLYAELVENRGFEYSPADKSGRDPNWNSFKAWSFSGDKNSFQIDTVNPIHPNQKHYAIIDVKNAGESLSNSGFNGIPVTEGDKYNFSAFTRVLEGQSQVLLIQLTGENGEVLAQKKTKLTNGNWKKKEVQLTAGKSCKSAKLELIPQSAGKLAFDMVSLFPQNTFKQRKNGLRNDLAQVIADMKPRFVRFPGGCVAHGDGLQNMYRWSRTVGPLEARVPQRNIWNYHQTAGLGYYEYFQFCEDIDAEPVPVLPAGVPCQNSGTCGHGQQGGIPLCEMDEYIQEVLDLIEWANGDKKTKWGKVRAEAGHPEPFNMKYIGIGNEDLISDVFEERFTMIFNAVKEKHPEITVIGTVGPFYTGTDYVEGWRLATELGVPMVDEHYYQPPGWFIHNQDYYDKYDRSKSKVYLGEYAAHLPGRPNNIETALSEALYLTAVERNADVVTMTSYAPLLAKEGFTQWRPDLIYFNNNEVKPTVGYYVQKMYGNNAGDLYISSNIKLSETSQDVKKRIAVSVVKDSKTNDIILKMVNLLPVGVSADVDFTGFNIISSSVPLSVLSGNPEDQIAKPAISNINVGNEFDYEMPPYSFSVVRLKTNP